MPQDNSQLVLSRLMGMEDDARNNTIVNNTVKTTVGQILGNIDDANVQLKVDNLRILEKHDNKNIAQQKDVRNKGQIWSNDIRADLKLIDKKTGQVIDKVDNMKIADVPKVTDRGTYLVGGNEYQFTNQARLKPGVYTKRQKNGEISSFFNVDKTVDFERGFNNNFKIEFDPEKKVFMMGYGSKHIPLINALRTVGVTDGELKSSWGKDVYDSNSLAYDKQFGVNQNKLYEAIFNKTPTKDLSSTNISEQIKERLFATELDPDVTSITLGKPYKNVNKNAILDASKKIIDIHKGEKEGDDREALIFKSFYGAEDHIREKLIKGSDKIVRNIASKLNKTRMINKSMSTGSFNPFIVGTITNSILSSPPNQSNPIAIIGESSKMTVMGEGGIGSANAVTNETRQISNSEMGFIDPLHTPEGSNIGVAVHTSMDTIKVGNELYSKFLKPNGEVVLLRPIDVYKKNIGFPDQLKVEKGKRIPVAGKIKIVREGLLGEVDKGKVDYYVANAQGMFDTSANSIPFLDSIQGNRGLTASKMQEQAISLTKREKPLFNIVDDKGKSLGETLAGVMALPRSPVAGKITKATDDHVIIKDDKGKDHVVHMYNNFSLNSQSFLHNEQKLRVGATVKKNELLADNNFTRDGQMALGANLHVAYLPYKGYNYEDSAIISKSAADKLTSQHMYDLKTKRTSAGVFSKSKYQAYYPEELNLENAKKLDKDGVVTVGQKLNRGDVVIAHLEKRSPSADDLMLGRLDKQLKRDMADNGVKWENDHVGVVTDVKKIGNSVVVNVKTEEPLKVADKISGFHGNKHIVSKIVPDDEMPFNTATGRRIDLTMSPIGVSNRINTSQLLENAAGKIAMKTGKQYEIMNFTAGDNSRRVLADMKAAGIEDKDILIDPETGKPLINPVSTGFSHILKLEHTVDHKYSARYRDKYDSNEQAASGGEKGGKNLGRMEVAALLARGAKENLKEMYSIKGQRNDEYWKAMETGQSLPPPKDVLVWDKQLAMMAGAGINVQQKGKDYILKPLTDKEILAKSKGELMKPTETYRLKDMAPMKEGLFDVVKAGGIQGDHFTHFKLSEKTLNPITEAAAASLVGLPVARLEDVLTGKKAVDKNTFKIVPSGTANSFSGGVAVESMLKAINVDEHLDQAKTALDVAKNATDVNNLNRKVKYLKALKDNNMKPEDYMISNMLVIPSKFRPVIAMKGDGGAVIMSDVNNLYQQVAHTSNALTGLKTQLDKVLPDGDVKDAQLAPIRGQLYQDVRALSGLQEPTSYKNRKDKKQGYIAQIAGVGKQAKEGFFQSKVVERRQDLVGRSTIILNPDLGGDEIGIPKTMASEMFAPKIMAKIHSWGYSPLEAQKEVNDDSKVFQRAREVVAAESLVIANRAPSLHKYNMTALKPILTDGKQIEVPGVIVHSNFGGDFDGDTFQLHVPISAKAQAEAEKMKPSANMLKTGYDSVLNAPDMDMVVGGWLVSKGKGGTDTKLKFDTLKDAREAFKQNKFTYADTVHVEGVKAPFGMHEINSVVPEDSRKYNIELDKKGIDNWIKQVNDKHNGKIALSMASKMAEIGNNYVTTYGFTLGVSDTLVDKEMRTKLLDEAARSSSKSDPSSIIKAYSKATAKGQDQLSALHGENTMLGIGIKSGGSKGIENTSAITMMPGIVMDADDRPIAMPIMNSYSEGLDTFGYWTAAHGARGGNIKKSVSSYMPGWLTKDLTNSIYDTKIHSDKPVDTKGLEYSVSDKKGVMNRFLARDVNDNGGKIIAKRNDLVNSDVVNKLVQRGINKIFVQSPLTDPTPGDGFSSYSYGVGNDGKKLNLGDDIGIVSAHTVTEPSLNMAMKSFHTGGAYKDTGKNVGTMFDQLDRTLRFTKNLPDKATVSSLNGTIKNINKSSIGGWDVHVSDGEKDDIRYVDPNNELTIKKGDKIGAGDRMSTGTISPHDMLKYKGMPETQRYLVNQISDLMGNKLDKRNIETIVRGVTNTTRILSAGSHPNFIRGDVAPLTTIEHYNENNRRNEDVGDALGDTLARDYDKFKKGTRVDNSVVKKMGDMGIKRIDVHKDPIVHEPFLTPTGIGAKAGTTENWIARLAHNRIKKVLEEGTTQGWKTTVDPLGHPIPTYVTGNYS